MATKITKIIANYPHKTYVEPFVGGGSVFWQLKYNQPQSKKCFVLNDINDLIITAYQVAIAQPESLQLKLASSLYSQSLHQRAKNIIKNKHNYSEIDIAWAVIYSIRCNFLPKIDDSWGHDASQGKRSGKNRAMQYARFLDYLPIVLSFLKSVYVSNEDAITCIKKWDSPHTLFYCDPPYPETDQFHYQGYSQNDFEQLIVCLSQIQGTAILSCYPNTSVPSNWKKYEFIKNCAIAKKSGITSERIEVVWVKPSNTETISTQLSLFA